MPDKYSSISAHHQKELVESAIAPEIQRLNFETMDGEQALEFVVGDALNKLGGNSKQYATATVAKLLDQYEHVEKGGLACAGLDPLTLEDSNWGSFKPDFPRIDKSKNKPIKYEHPKGEPTGVFCLRFGLETAEKISERYGVELPNLTAIVPNQSPAVLWQWAIDNPSIPVVITEGAKKTASLLSQGYVALGLPGIWGGYRKESGLIPQLIPFLQPGREIIFAFDNDTNPETVKAVKAAIATTGPLIEKRGCKVSVTTWGGTAKGIDDVIVQYGENALDDIFRKRVSLNEFCPNIPLTEDRLKLAIKAYIAEKDPYKKDRMLANFYQQKISDNRIKTLVNYELAASSTQRATRIKPDEFRRLASGGKPWLISGLLPATGVTLLTGIPGGKKTTLAYDLAGSVINGTSFMGEPIKENGFVIFACSDEPITEAQERATMQGFIHSENYEYIDGFNIGQIDLLEESIDINRPKLVIVDSFDSIHRDSGHDENSTASSFAIKQLNDLAKKYSTQIVVIHHENKDPKLSGVNKSRGSTAIVAAANAHIRLIPVPDEDTRVMVSVEKIRGGETRKILCDVDFNNVRFEPEVNLDYEKAATARETILAFLQANPGKWYEAQELSSYLTLDSKGIYRPLKQLSSRGEIQIKPNSKGRKGMVYGFGCTGDDNSYIPPSLSLPSKIYQDSKNVPETLTQQGIEDSGRLVAVEWPLSGRLVADKNDVTPETLTQSDSGLVTSEGGTGGECVTLLENVPSNQDIPEAIKGDPVVPEKKGPTPDPVSIAPTPTISDLTIGQEVLAWDGKGKYIKAKIANLMLPFNGYGGAVAGIVTLMGAGLSKSILMDSELSERWILPLANLPS